MEQVSQAHSEIQSMEEYKCQSKEELNTTLCKDCELNTKIDDQKATIMAMRSELHREEVVWSTISTICGKMYMVEAKEDKYESATKFLELQLNPRNNRGIRLTKKPIDGPNEKGVPLGETQKHSHDLKVLQLNLEGHKLNGALTLGASVHKEWFDGKVMRNNIQEEEKLL